MRRLFPIAAVLLLSACSTGFDVMSPQPVTALTPLELPGRQVLSASGRNVGQIDDVIVGVDGKPAQLVVGIGAPMTMVRRHVAVDVAEARFSAPMNAVVLNGDLSPEQVASRPETGYEEGMIALNRVVPSGREPTNWYGATAPAPR